MYEKGIINDFVCKFMHNVCFAGFSSGSNAKGFVINNLD